MDNLWIAVACTLHFLSPNHILKNEDKIVPNTDNLWYMQFYSFSFMLVIDTIV